MELLAVVEVVVAMAVVLKGLDAGCFTAGCEGKESNYTNSLCCKAILMNLENIHTLTLSKVMAAT
jgi:acetate kinase